MKKITLKWEMAYPTYCDESSGLVSYFGSVRGKKQKFSAKAFT
jgi:hypothetical protein